MKKSILIIDDDKAQVENLARHLKKELSPDNHIITAYEEQDILDKLNNIYYSVVVLDLRMDNYQIDGIQLAKKVIDTNPFAKIIIVSAFKMEFLLQLKDLLLTGKVLDIIEKENFLVFANNVKNKIEQYHNEVFGNQTGLQNALLDSYAECKNEDNAYNKGLKFENFISLLFNDMGFEYIKKRHIDQSRNEVDLVVRNDVDDLFLSKFGKYFLIECKNMPNDNIDKNMFIIFKEKLANTANMSEFGIFATTGNFAKTVYLEAIRQSKSDKKILFLSNSEFEQLIKSNNRRETFKAIIDEQVKDN